MKKPNATAIQETIGNLVLTGEQQLPLLQQLTNLLPFPVTLLHLNGQMIFANREWLQYTGAQTEEALLNNWPLYIHPADQPQARALFTYSGTTQPTAFELRIRRHDGRFMWFMAQPSPLANPEGKPQYLLAICNNIDDKKQLENNLVQKEERLNLALSASNMGIFDYDAITNTSILNDTARVMYDLEPGDHFGFAEFIARVHPEDREAIAVTNYNAMTNPEAPLNYHAAFRVCRKDGSVRWYVNTGRVFVNEQGLRYRMLGTIVDQTTEMTATEQLRINEERLRLAGEASQTAWWHNDLTQGVLTASPIINDIFGLPPATTFTFNHFAEAIHPDDRTRVMDLNLDLMEGRSGKTHYETNFRIVIPGGHLRWVRALGRIHLNAAGRPSRFVGTAQDITQQMESAALLEASEAKLRIITDVSPVALWMTNTKGTLTFTNKTWKTWTGQTAGRIKLKDLLEMVLPEDREKTAAAFETAFSLRQPYTIDYRITNAEGEVRWLLTEGKPYYNGPGNFAGLVGSSVDITIRKLAEISLRESETRFRQLADSIPQVVWTATPEGTTDYYNQRWYHFTGQREGFGDNSWIPCLHPDDVQYCLDTWYHAVRTGTPYEIEYRWWHARSGQYRWVLGKALPLRDELGNIVKWLGTGTDIHDTRNIAEALEEAVQRRTREYIRLNNSLQRSNEDLQHFAHVASHDLKEPLRKIKVFSDQLMQKAATDLSEDNKVLLNKIMGAATRMSAMVDGILNYSILGNAEEQTQLVALEAVIDLVQTDLELLIAQKKACIQTGSLPTIEGHPILLQQLFENLIANALKFSRDDAAPEISISAHTLPATVYEQWPHLHPSLSYYQLTVSDNGIGFAAESAEKIFDVFHRLHPVARYEGTGLGLSLCRKIVQRHHGHIFAESTPGQGTRFHIILPLQQPGGRDLG